MTSLTLGNSVHIQGNSAFRITLSAAGIYSNIYNPIFFLGGGSSHQGHGNDFFGDDFFGGGGGKKNPQRFFCACQYMKIPADLDPTPLKNSCPERPPPLSKNS